MATTYVGPRPILKGRNFKTSVNTYNGKPAVYSNWLLMSPDHVLDGAPDRQYVVGKDNRYAKARLMSQLFTGSVFYTSPMDKPGLQQRQINGRFHPYENKGLTGANVFPSSFGHVAFRNLYYSEYSNFVYDGLPSAEPLKAPGHARRYSVSFGGAFDPLLNKGVTVQALNNPGQPAPAGATNLYGHNRVNEWRGVPSSRVL